MKTSFHLVIRTGSAIAIAVLLALTPVHSAPSPSGKTSAVRSTQTNDIPRSTFVVPKSLKEGRDPFYPNADYFLNKPAPVVKIAPVTPMSPVMDLTVNGLSGPPEKRLAMINYRTFAAGEKGEVPTRTGRLLIQCVEIKEDSVVVEVNGKRELLLFSGK